MESVLKNRWIYNIKLTEPSLKDNTADLDRLIQAVKARFNTENIVTDINIAKEIPDILRKSGFNVNVLIFDDYSKKTILSVQDAQDKSIRYAGAAVDIGTTRIGVRLIDLADGNIIAESSFDNPQIQIGPDILARIHFAHQKQGADHLNKILIESINNEIKKLCTQNSLDASDVFVLHAAGNTAMSHFFMGLDTKWIIREPYIPAVNTPFTLKAKELGIKINQNAAVFIFPNIGSYFGGDLIAGILYCGLHKSDSISMLVDVGTNAEVICGCKDWLIACAGAAGPALEGGVANIGMKAGIGAIERVKLTDDRKDFAFNVIGDTLPQGICGSGIIDLAARLFEAEMIDIRGRFIPEKCGKRLTKDSFNLVEPHNSASGSPLNITRADIESLIRSKAAMYAILETITSTVGIDFKDIENFYVAGTFGSFIDPASAMTIGMLPRLPISKYKALGNSSLKGAALALISNDRLKEIESIRKKITYIELNVNQDFMNRFSAAKFIPHTNAELFRA